MQYRLLAAGSLLCGATFAPSAVKATPQEETNIAVSLKVEGCRTFVGQNTKRTALLIANEAYEYLDKLQTPIPDAKALGNSLGKLGFTVTLCTNLTSHDIVTATLNYGLKLEDTKDHELSVFYYAGHGTQDSLHGVDTPLDPGKRRQPAKLAEIISYLDPDAHLRDSAAVLIIDACRTLVPKQVEAPAAKPDATVVASPDGSFVVYSTAPGMTASDAAIAERKGHSLFAAELLDELNARPTQDVDAMFRAVRQQVKKGSRGKQIPWTSHSLVRKVSFKESQNG